MSIIENLENAIEDVGNCKDIPIYTKIELIDIGKRILYIFPKNEDAAMRYANQVIFTNDFRKKAESLSTKSKKVVYNIINLFECFVFYDIPDL